MLKNDEPAHGAPAWIVTYGDLMGLLLCFFVVLVSMGEIKPDRFQQAVGSLHRAFGGTGHVVDPGLAKTSSGNPLVDRLLAPKTDFPRRDSQTSNDQAMSDTSFAVTTGRDGVRITIAGTAAFESFSATLHPQAREYIAETAQVLAGSNTKLLIRGHAASEPPSPAATFSDLRDLSYARAVAVANELERSGVRRYRMILVAAGETEPLVQPALTDEQRARNRRVEIIVTEDLATEVGGSNAAAKWQESFNGG